MNDLQALVTGMLIGALMRQDDVVIDIFPQYDEKNNYLPEFIVEGKVSGTKLRVKVEMEADLGPFPNPRVEYDTGPISR